MPAGFEAFGGLGEHGQKVFVIAGIEAGFDLLPALGGDAFGRTSRVGGGGGSSARARRQYDELTQRRPVQLFRHRAHELEKPRMGKIAAETLQIAQVPAGEFGGVLLQHQRRDARGDQHAAMGADPRLLFHPRAGKRMRAPHPDHAAGGAQRAIDLVREFVRTVEAFDVEEGREPEALQGRVQRPRPLDLGARIRDKNIDHPAALRHRLRA